MKKLSNYMEDYYEFSGKASDVARKLAFAGIALIWIFKIETQPTPKIPPDLVLPTALLALTLAFDLLQYVAATCVWGVFQWYHERRIGDTSKDPEIDAPSLLKWPQFIFFVLKLCTVLLAYILITIFIAGYMWSAVGKN